MHEKTSTAAAESEKEPTVPTLLSRKLQDQRHSARPYHHYGQKSITIVSFLFFTSKGRGFFMYARKWDFSDWFCTLCEGCSTRSLQVVVDCNAYLGAWHMYWSITMYWNANRMLFGRCCLFFVVYSQWHLHHKRIAVSDKMLTSSSSSRSKDSQSFT